MCYSKSLGIRVMKGTERKTDQYASPDKDPRGPWASANMTGLLDAEQRPNCHYDLINPETGINYGRPKMGWRYDRNAMNRLIQEKRIIWPDSPTGRPRKKSFLSEISVVLLGYSSVIGEKVYTRDGTKQIDELFEKRPFDFPKPLELVYQLVEQASDSSSTVLDFFAGSGTTLHAVMQLNKEDGGHRQCILVTNNENNLRYYCTRLLPRERTNRNMRALVNASTDLLCIKENLYDEVVTNGVELTRKDFRMFGDGERAMMVIYNEETIPDIVGWMKSQPESKEKIKVYVFSPGAYAWDDDFAPVLDRVELCALPEAIYQAYKSVLPKKRTQRRNEEPTPKGENGITMEQMRE